MPHTSLYMLNKIRSVILFFDQHPQPWIDVQPIKATVNAIKKSIHKIESAYLIKQEITLEQSEDGKFSPVEKLYARFDAATLADDVESIYNLLFELEMWVSGLLDDNGLKEIVYRIVPKPFV